MLTFAPKLKHTMMKKYTKGLALAALLLLMGNMVQAQTQVTGMNIENVYIPAGSADDQTILIVGALDCGSAIGVTKTKKWSGTPEYGDFDGNGSLTTADNGDHTYQNDGNFNQVRTPIAKVEPASPTQTWAFNAFQKFVFFDDKDLYGVWSFNYSKNSNTYTNQCDYFVETWRAYANSGSAHFDASNASAVQVKSAQGFAHLARLVNSGTSHTNKWYYQTADFDLSGHYWEPIGFGDLGDGDCGINPTFQGNFDGRGHFIDNALSVLPVTQMGLFGELAENKSIIRTFDYGCEFTYTNSAVGNMGGIVGTVKSGGTIDGCESAKAKLTKYNGTGIGNVSTGGVAGQLAGGTLVNSFAVNSEINGQNAGGLVGNVSTTSYIRNSYTKANTVTGTTLGSILGFTSDAAYPTIQNCYSDATTRISGTKGLTKCSNNYAPMGYSGGESFVKKYTATISADDLGYMWADNVVQNPKTPLFEALNNNLPSGGSRWARPALAYYENLNASGTAGTVVRPINDDLPVLLLCESSKRDLTQTDATCYAASAKAYQGGFRTVGTRGGAGNVLQYGGGDRDGNTGQLDKALTRPCVGGAAKDFLFIYGDFSADQKATAATSSFTQAKVSIYEHVAIEHPGTLGQFNETYVGVTFSNEGGGGALATSGINQLGAQRLRRDWHIVSTPLTNAPIGFDYKGHNTGAYSGDEYGTNSPNNSQYWNNPWKPFASGAYNNHAGTEFAWLNGNGAGNNRYWMAGWDNSLSAGTVYSDNSNNNKYPKSGWQDGYFPSRLKSDVVTNPGFVSSSDEYPAANTYRYPYGMDFYCWTEPDYHYINFKRNGPNHWHSDQENDGRHKHIAYNPGTASNVSGEQNKNETIWLNGKGYMASIGAKTLLQSHGTLGNNSGNISKSIKVSYTKEAMMLNGWNLVGNPFHGYLDFNKLCEQNSSINPYAIFYNAKSYGVNDDNNFGNGFSIYYKEGSSGGAYASRYIHPHQGFYVSVTGSSNLVFQSGTGQSNMVTTRSECGGVNHPTFRDGDDFDRPAYPLVNLFLKSDKGCNDLCIVEFNRPAWQGVEKMSDLRSGNGMFYAFHEEQNYAVLFATPEAERIPIRFVSSDPDGDTYNISWNTANGDFTSLYLVDNKTGVQYDMLRNSSYSFQGKQGDYRARFYITFNVLDVDEYFEDDDTGGTVGTTFAFYDGSQWVVTGGGNLQMIDLQGRILYHTTLGPDGQARVSLPSVASGMYLLRLTNQKETKVQKVIIR